MKSPSQKGSSANWNEDEYAMIIEDIKRVYRSKIKPLEVTYNFEGSNVIYLCMCVCVYHSCSFLKTGFHSAPLTDSDIEAKPMVLLIGQYSTVRKIVMIESHKV